MSFRDSISNLLTGHGGDGNRALGDGEAHRERRALAELARHRDRAPELLDDALGDSEAQAEAALLGGDEVVEDRAEALGRNARAGVGDAHLDLVAISRGGDGDAPAGLRRLDGVCDEVAVYAAKREDVAFDDDRLR